jgi:OHS family lactose permease-like MFS transporter
MWVVSVLLVLIAPFFLYVFAPLLKTNIWIGALSGGAYIGFVFSAGAGAMEAYIERVSRNSGFEYGKARTFGCLGWALCATTAGMLFSVNPEWVFWMGSVAALLLLVLVAIAKPQASQATRCWAPGGQSFRRGFENRGAHVPPAQNVDVYFVCGWRGLRL